MTRGRLDGGPRIRHTDGMSVPTTIDEYLAAQPEAVRERLQQVREAIHRGAPGGGEGIKYGMPMITPPGEEGRYLVYFAGWTKHVALYPIPTAPAALEAELAPLRRATDALHFVHAKPLPLDLIERIAAWMLARRTEAPAD